MLYCKGADSTVYERLSADCAQIKEDTTLHLEVVAYLAVYLVFYRCCTVTLQRCNLIVLPRDL